MQSESNGPGPNPSGLCMCGCGELAPLAQLTNRRLGNIRGKPQRYIFGHQLRKSPVEFTVEDRGHKTPCHIWQRSCNDEGYGSKWDGKRLRPAHVLAWESEHGPVPAGMELDHLCRVHSCIRPDHLEPVTSMVNAQRGASAKLTPADVRIIRSLAGSMTLEAIGRRFGVQKSIVSKIILRKVWTNVD